MNSKLISHMQRLQGWRLITILSACILVTVEIIVTVMSLILKGEIANDYLITGIVAALLVAPASLVLINHILDSLKQAQLATLEVEALQARMNLEMAIDAAQMDLWEIDLTTYAIKYNTARIKIPGFTAAEPPRDLSAWLSSIHPDDAGLFRQRMQEAMQPGAANFDFEYRVSLNAGEWTWVHTKGGITQRDATGKPMIGAGSTTNITARKLAELKAQETQARLEHFFNSNPDLMLISRLADGCITEVNDAFVRSSGYSREEAIGNTTLSLGIWTSGTDRERMTRELVSKGYCDHLEAEFHAKSGMSYTGSVAAVITRLHGVPHIVSTVRDITIEKNNEKEIKQKQALLRTTLESTDEGILMIAGDGRVLSANHRFHELWQIPDEIASTGRDDLLLGHVLEQLIDPNVFLDQVKRLYGSDEEARDLLHFKDGRVFARFTKALWIGEEHGRIWCFKDITEQQHTEDELRQSDLRFRTLFDSSPDPIWIIDGHRFVECNQAAVDMLGYPDKSALRNTHPSQLSPEFQPDGELSFNKAEQMMNIAQEKGLNRFEWVHTRKDGSELYAEVTLSPITLQNRQAIYCVWRNITERKRIEQSLLAESEKNRAFLRNASDGIHILDIEGNVVEASDSFCTMLGYSRDEVIGMNVSQWEAKHDAADIKIKLRKQFNNPNRSEFESTHRHKDGSLLNVEISGLSLMWAGKQLLFNSSRDITARKKTEAELRAVKERYDYATRVGKVGTWDWNPQSSVLAWSDETYRLMGFTPGSVIPTYEMYLGLVHPDDQAILNSAVEASLQNKGPYLLDHRVVLNDGTEKTCHVTGNVEFDADDRPIRMLGTIQDISERKQAEVGLRASEQKMLTILDNVDAYIYLKDIEGKYLFANRNVRELWGVEMEDIIGFGDERFFDAVTAANIRINDRGVLERGETHTTEETNTVVATGKTFTYLSTKLPLRREDGSVYALCGVSTDITARIRSEEALQASEERARTLFTLLRLITDNVTDLIWAKDMNKRFVFANKAVCDRLLNAKDTDEPIGKDDMFFAKRERDSRPDDPDWHTFGELCQDSDTITLQNGKHSQFDEYGNVKGKFLFLDVHKTPFINDKGEVIGVVGSGRDVTEQKAIEEKLRLASMVLENSSEAMFITDAEGYIIETNPAFTKLTGYAAEEAIGKKPTILNSGKHEPTFYQAMWKELEMNGHWQGEIWNRRKNGEVFAEWQTINTVFNEDGSIHRHVALFSDITEKKKSEELIWSQANFDLLTSLPNRRMFRDRLTQDIKKAHRAGLGLALMFLDLDRFKEVNDSLGHDAGDALLVEAARRIADCVRESDTVARLGGDEFTIILSELEDRSSVERIAADILYSLSQPFELENDIAYVSASIGITVYPDDATSLEDMLKNADQAMYVAKNSGRNRFSYFTNAMQESALYRQHILNDLRSALVEQQFQLHYQPIVDIHTGRIHKAEALLRWFHPKRGLISPAEFIPLAEESGLIHEIGDWVFEQAVAQALTWTADYGSDFQISVNKSPIQIQTRSERCKWKDHLAKSQLSGRSLVIEITEGVLLDHTPAVVSELLAFRDAGIQVAIDDFGTGYSALSYLKKLDIDYVKIDQSFILNLDADDNDKALAEAIVVMAHKLGLKVIAEGVETQLQLDLLAQMGCDYAQGFLYARALAPEDFELLMKNRQG